MEQLLKITTIPIEYELTVHNAHLERKNGTAEVEISRDKGGMKITSRPIRLRVDTYEARNSVVPTTKTAIYQAAQKGKQATYEATAQFAEEGQILLNAKIGEGAETLQSILDQRNALPTGQFKLGFIPETGPDIEWDPPSISISYQMDKLNFDTRIDWGRVEFVPGSIELSVQQYPDVHIEYIGNPIYVPPSAAGRFTGQNIDTKA
ncbi:DUF6470 family protein [Muricomes intestini]|jgi:hypothetical protein|uniref:Uncharacterized protein n=1 Tax=Muricomes intestini TaxID=1796634 RepID=A0A4R3KHT9_9FIRM|nr:DUF6470 family protein [Muricomes intestini]TCS82811.1 hypothetical protein EDD59_101220 [Muricomes intestini]HAX52798.1 hypothetical protein [Lachnospiraceae bacterium]HCR84255.1 hypothetical protein [Lachnospiraceae bacterium]